MLTRTPHFVRTLPPVPFAEELGNVLDRATAALAYGVLLNGDPTKGFAREADLYFTGAGRRTAPLHDGAPLARVWKAPAVYALALGVDRADPDTMRTALAALVDAVNRHGHPRITLPKLGCSALGGGLDYVTVVRPLLAEFLDERFTVLINLPISRQGGRKPRGADPLMLDGPDEDVEAGDDDE
jgi:hypothetical protein